MTARGGAPLRGSGPAGQAPPGRPLPFGPAGDEAALDAARAGDLRAWGYLIRGHQGLVFRTAWLIIRDASMAEESTTIAFARAYRSLLSLQTGALLRPWLMGITAATSRAEVRKAALSRDEKTPVLRPNPRLAAIAAQRDAADPMVTETDEVILRDAFDGLSEQDRLVVASRYLFGLTRTEAASLLGVPVEQIETRLAASVGRLRHRVRESIAPIPGAHARSEVPTDPRIERLAALGDDRLGRSTMAVVVSGLRWTPDVAPAVCERLAREAAAYPEHLATAVPATGAGTASASADSQGPTSPVLTATTARRPATDRGIGFRPMALSALVVVFALVGLSMVVETDGVDPATGALTRPEPASARPEPAGARPAATGSGTAPAVARAPQLSIVGARMFEDGDLGVRVSLAWSPHAGIGDIVRARLERKVDDGTWEHVSRTAAPGAFGTAIRPGRDYRFRVRAHDETGAVAVSPTVMVDLAVRDPGSPELQLGPDDWVTRSGKTIERRLVATSAAAGLSTTFDGSHVAIVGPTGPTRGAIGVRIDGGTWTSEDLRDRTSSPRTMVFSRDLVPGRHLLDLRAEANGVAVDAVLIVNAEPVQPAG